MRIGIREQFAVVVLLTALVPLMVLAVATWVNQYAFVTNVTGQQLSLTASLKAAQIAADLLLIQSTCATIPTRIIVQNALKNFYRGNGTGANWTAASTDVSSALAGGGLSSLLQLVVYSRNETGNPKGLFNTTANTTGIVLPNTNGVLLGQGTEGFPSALYPNISYTNTTIPDPADTSQTFTQVSAFDDFPLNQTSVLLLGPIQINETYALLSMTLPIIDNLNPQVCLGFMTIVAAASSLMDVIQSREGLGNSGMVLLVGSTRRENMFKYEMRPSTATYKPPPAVIGNAQIKYIFPPTNPQGRDRHRVYLNNLTTLGSSNFTVRQYPAVVNGFGGYDINAINNAGSLLSTRNENNISVSVGYARPRSALADWLLIIEQSHSEAWAPVVKLRVIVLACVFGSIGLILFVVVPTAHYSVRPIRRLRDATEKSITPPGYTPNGSVRSGRFDDTSDAEDPDLHRSNSAQSKKTGIFIRLRNMTSGGKRKTKSQRNDDHRRRGFKIPARVQDRKHWVTDELTELTFWPTKISIIATFNEMTDELMLQYQGLEEKVAERTRELEISKKAAEAANESKTLFIANISHELKTPLNGILGMCAVCMGEDDLPRIKRSLQVVYKSGDLLLHLLNDLLTFSKNQIGQQLSLEEREFRLSDIKTQIVTIFTKQVQEKNIQFAVRFVGTDTDIEPDGMAQKKLPALGPKGTGRLKDMSLWGDQHRILQVVINLVSNSLKFTPAGGKVEVRIKCLGEAESTSDGSRNSLQSKESNKQGSQKRSRGRHHDTGSNASQISRKASDSSGNKSPQGTALQINPMDPAAAPKVQIRERSPTPPPSNARTLVFQFEVEDTGPGIPEGMQERVFEPFVQGDLGLSKKFGGTGLGLSICHQLSQLMNGEISLVSSQTIPTGTTFKVKIPLKYTKSRAPSTSSSDVHGPSRSRSADSVHVDGSIPPPAGAAGSSSRNSGDFEKDAQPRLIGLSQPFFASNPGTGTSPDGKAKKESLSAPGKSKEPPKKLRILVAEDNLVNQEIVIRMLKLEHIYDVEVVVAEDGKQAYDIVKENMDKGQYFNLIFMDIQMPNLDGLQSTRLIRQMGYSAPIVALTAFSEESNVKECYDSGMDHFLSKPIRRPALKQVLQKFATIPEEAENSSAASTPEEHRSSSRELSLPSDNTDTTAETTTIANGSIPRPL
ncbi:hypothetical protein HYFRA_00007351 [Hymenoscyphus fraxineus]|uniref:histidine kinase n=1 Tax=Hymenoscyphus fraxineus TaxID=746836 RepID=A0A9N9KSQ1_9HELO|nr:hypothetical protein HYFRA_00007351 [Hymenoscyphus fraxineus]